MKKHKLFLAVLGAKPPGRNTEQHDVFFGIASCIEDCFEQMKKFWPVKIHLDSYMSIDQVDGFDVSIDDSAPAASSLSLYFINFGGYKPKDLEEYHLKIVVAAETLAKAKAIAKKHPFYTAGLVTEHAQGHLDDKQGIEALLDDCIDLQEALTNGQSIRLTPNVNARFSNNSIVAGYFPIPD